MASEPGRDTFVKKSMIFAPLPLDNLYCFFAIILGHEYQKGTLLTPL